MADGEDMIITWSRPREPLVWRHRVHTNVHIDVQERENIKWFVDHYQHVWYLSSVSTICAGDGWIGWSAKLPVA